MFSIKKDSFIFFMFTYVHVSTGALRGQRALNPLVLELQAVVSHQMEVLGIKPRSSVEQ